MSNRLLWIGGALILAALIVGAAEGETLSMIKQVPEGASIQYLVGGSVQQSMPLRPGSYRITVELLDGGASLRNHVRRRR